MRPISVPTLIAMPTATKPMRIEMRAPKRMREKRSRPSLSVPKRWWTLGGWVVAARFCARGSAGAMSGAKSAAATTIAMMIRPASAPGLRRKRTHMCDRKLRPAGTVPAAVAGKILDFHHDRDDDGPAPGTRVDCFSQSEPNMFLDVVHVANSVDRATVENRA